MSLAPLNHLTKSCQLEHLHQVSASNDTWYSYPPKAQQVKGWTYLLSDIMTFKQHDYAIRLHKPLKDDMFHQCAKIICSGKVSELYIENHEFDESETKQLALLAKSKEVNVVLLTVERSPLQRSANTWLH